MANVLARMMDAVLGWVLLLPRDLGLLVVAALTAALIVGLRRWTTDQSRLARFRADRRRLRMLLREARRRQDRDATRRCRVLLGRLGGRMLAAEFRPLLASVIPVALLAGWCFERLPFLPVVAGRPLEVRLYHPVTASGSFVHLVPADGLDASDGWIRPFAPDPAAPSAAVATWQLTPEHDGLVELVFRARGRRLVHELPVGRRGPVRAVIRHEGPAPCASQLVLTPRRLLGVVPGIPVLGIPPWLTGYLLLACGLVMAGKRVFRVA
ncbi:MAG: hypothetical protein JXR37_32840 [Kiritimatiellae bacterium]|nr:hypothetical protein [Kiritimatiellia bacterium]